MDVQFITSVAVITPARLEHGPEWHFHHTSPRLAVTSTVKVGTFSPRTQNQGWRVRTKPARDGPDLAQVSAHPQGGESVEGIGVPGLRLADD